MAEIKLITLSFYDENLNKLGSETYKNITPSKGDYILLNNIIYMILGKLFGTADANGILIKRISVLPSVTRLEEKNRVIDNFTYY